MSFFSNMVRQKQWRRIVLLALAAALLVLAAVRITQSFLRAGSAKQTPVTQMQLKSSEVMTVAPTSFEQTLPLSGSLNPYTQATVSARAAGEVARVLVREGQTVQQGELLAVLVDTTYRAQYDQAVANELSAVSSLKLAEQDYQNNVQLVKEGFISSIALQKLAVARESARAQLQNATQAKVIAQRALSEVNIKAPVSGVIAARDIREGETAAVGTPMFSIVNIDSFELQAPISAEQIGAIQQGQTVQLTSVGVAEPFTGTVERINPAATNGSRSYAAYIKVDNTSGLLKVGMFAQGQIVITARDGVLNVPATALHTRDQTQYVYLVKDNKLAEQTVTTGTRSSDAIDAPVEIVLGLGSGDVVVRQDLGQLVVETDVVILNADGSKPEGESKSATPPTWWQKITRIFSS
jgi:RND family efflux transporter MFP subunit